ncbi:MAG TPA: hypothetical protein VHE54_12010, partial [Puia sp.]|nr:hypothetical protein [Puia sp.]
WQPYTWSLNNVALAECLHTALAYWQGGRPEEAFRLWKSALVESMYMGSGPGNFEQIASYDVARGELYRDFADPIGMAARSLVEGLFGIHPDALHDTLTITPGWPADWAAVSLHIPDIRIDYSHDRYTIIPSFAHPMTLRLRLHARSTSVRGITINGHAQPYTNSDAIGGPMLEIVVPPAPSYDIAVSWGVMPVRSTLIGKAAGFKHLRQGTFSWWEPVDPDAKTRAAGETDGTVEPQGSGLPGKGRRVQQEAWALPGRGRLADTVSLARYFNDDITHIFTNRYLSPRPKVPTLQLPTQGIGNWCYPLVTATIDDAGLRHARGVIRLPNGIAFSTPPAGHNIVFTSRWDNYPDSASIPLTGRASHAWFLLAGTTNPMQSRIANGAITVHYTDGTTDRLELVNPSNWWPIEEDYLEDGPAFTTGAPRPWRVYLKTGVVSDKPGKWTTIKGLTNTAIDGGAATVADMPLRPDKTLDHLEIRALARDVIVGLLGITLIKTSE